MAGSKDVEYMKTFFESLDTDKSNSISVKEIKQFYLELQYPEEKAQQEAEDVMKDLGKEVTDTITWEEFKEILDKRQ